jgi:hypothetical protein
VAEPGSCAALHNKREGNKTFGKARTGKTRHDINWLALPIFA